MLAGVMENINHPPEVKGTLVRLATSFAAEKAATDVRVGFAVQPQRDVLTVEARGLETTQRAEPFKTLTPEIVVKTVDVPVRIPPDPSLGKVATQIELHMQKTFVGNGIGKFGSLIAVAAKFFRNSFHQWSKARADTLTRASSRNCSISPKMTFAKSLCRRGRMSRTIKWTEFHDVSLRPKTEANAANESSASIQTNTISAAAQPPAAPDYIKALSVFYAAAGIAEFLDSAIKKHDNPKLAAETASQMLGRLREYNQIVKGTSVEVPAKEIEAWSKVRPPSMPASGTKRPRS